MIMNLHCKPVLVQYQAFDTKMICHNKCWNYSIKTIACNWLEDMLSYLSVDIICSENIFSKSIAQLTLRALRNGLCPRKNIH